MIPLSPATFRCHGCGVCCRDHAQGEPRWPAAYGTLAPLGLYALPTRDGLGVTSEERARLLRAGRRLGARPRFRPTLAALDGGGGTPRLVALAWETDTRECVFVTPENRCRAYAERPLACRAFPLRARGGALAASPRCGAAFEPPDGDVTRAYASEASAATEAGGFLRRALERVQALETEGALRPVQGAARDQVAEFLEEGAVVDVLELSRAPTGERAP